MVQGMSRDAWDEFSKPKLNYTWRKRFDESVRGSLMRERFVS